MKIIVSLGNPGEKYQSTRHNVGFMVVNAMANEQKLEWQYNKKFKAEITSPQPSHYQGEVEKERLILVKPQTFVNNSGQAIQAIMSYYKLLPKKLGIITTKNNDLSEILTVIHDDIDIELNRYKIAIDSRSAGHKGVQSIIQYLKTQKFKRIRIGIRTEAANNIPADKFVLQQFSEEEMNIINDLIPIIINEL